MTLTNSKSWLSQAQAGRFALGAFNANNMEQVQAIVLAAQAEQAPVIIQFSHRALAYAGGGRSTLGLRYFAELGRIAAESVQVPVVLHLDHGSEAEVLQAAALGFTSAMFDGGELPFEENVQVTRSLCEAAHAAGMTLEAEIGEVARLNPGGAPADDGELTDPVLAAEFAKRTGVDALAIALGSIHGGKKKDIELDLVRLCTIRSLVSLPLVLHGSSGVTDANIRQGIELGLCKVNVATQLNQAFTAAVRTRLAEKPDEVDPRPYLRLATAQMQAVVQERLRFFGVSQKAAGYSN